MQQAHFVFALSVGLIASFSSISNADEWTDPNKKPNSITLGTQLFGQEIDLSKPSLVNFWATWCAPCIKEIPDLQEAARALTPEIQVLLVNVGESEKQIRFFADSKPELELANGTAVLQGFEFSALPDWGMRGLPTSYLIDDGKVLKQAEGILEWADSGVQQTIRQHLGLVSP